MSDIIEVDGETVVVNETDVDVVTIAPGDTVPFLIEDSGTTKVSNAAGINFKTNLTVTDDGDKTVTVDLSDSISLAGTLTATGLITANGNINFGQTNLGHYEEGTFTLTPADGDYTITQNNHYTRIGNLMTLFVDFRVTATSSAGTGTFQLNGIPANPADNAHSTGAFNLLRGLTVGGEFVAFHPSGSTLLLRHFDLAGGNESAVGYSDWGSTFWFRGVCQYRV